MTILESFKKIDLLGKKPNLIIYKNESHKSLVGGILSILTILIFFSALGYFFHKLFDRKTFTSIKSDIFDRNQTFNINQTNLLHFHIRGFTNYDQKKKIYEEYDIEKKIVVTCELYDDSNDGIIATFPLKRCEENVKLNLLSQDDPNVNLENLDDFEDENMLCLPNDFDFELKENNIQSLTSKYLMIKFSFSVNNANCYSKKYKIIFIRIDLILFLITIMHL